MLNNIKQKSKFRLHRSTPYQKSIAVLQCYEICAISFCGWSPKNNPGGFSNIIINICFDPQTNIRTSFFSLVRTWNSVTHCPDRLVYYNYFSPIFDIFFESWELQIYDLICFFIVPLFFSLTNTVDNPNIAFLCLFYFLVNRCLSLV